MEKFKQEIKNIGSNKLAYSIDLNNQKITKSEIVKSWGKAYSEKVANGSLGNGLRPPQYGALSAIRSHWVVSNEPATIVLPTGTGKSETIDFLRNKIWYNSSMNYEASKQLTDVRFKRLV
ncbi:hypothetical protein, partial [Streptococcus agalactiae]|uniref:hypothetical protein n=1 Tax=Streptococcus agalactiae TaxID=1311 RepID=UPI001F2E5DA7